MPPDKQYHRQVKAGQRYETMISQKKILVVEDNEINRMILREILSPQYKVLEAGNGAEALSVLREYGEMVSLILLDIVMPVMDGYTFLSHIKADSSFSSIPVIVTTQSDSESDEVAALSHGAADFVAKPYRAQVILHRVASIIHLRETAAMINLVQYDRLTGLYSKEFFYQRVRETLMQHPDREYDIICSDIVNFKLINDIFGIPAGDHLLNEIGRLYKKVAGKNGICGHFHADQFACLLERRWNYTDELFIRCNARINTLPNARNVVMKWGIYQVADRNVSVEQMCDRALLAARSIKGRYGTYFAAYDDELRNRLLREQAITDSMEPALAKKEFEVYLQPKYRIRDHRLSGAEALVRWKHPVWGFQSPGEFIPLFEQNGFITKLDQFVWDKACAMLRDWDQKGYPQLSISVNVSRADIYNIDIAGLLKQSLGKYALDVSRLYLEITESAYSERPDRIVAAFDELAERGFTVLMDDFGSGYSSLNMLKDINVDVLKIDMRFLDRDDRRSKDIMESVIRMARWLDLPVIAEGVETREQVNFLLDVGCSYAQGYYYARPMEAAAFEALLTDGSKVQHEQCALQDARRPILDFRDLLHENTISDRMLSSIIGSVALYSYADGDLRLIRGNEAYRRLIATLGEGVNGAEEGGSLLPFVHDEDRDALVAAAEETVRSCPDDGVEVVVRRMGTNGCHWHKMRLFHLNTTNGSATVYGSVTDVTERMEYMEALRKSEQRFEMTLEASGTVVFELDIPTRTARYSEFLQQAFGLAETVANAPEGFIEQGTVAEESIEDFRAIYRDLYAGAPRTSAVVRAIMGDGSRAWNRVTLLAMPNEAGAPVKAVGLVENVTRETEMDLLLKRLGRFEQD